MKMFCKVNCVEVNYDLNIRDKTTGRIDKFEECHRMRYLFLPEIEQFLEAAGMKPVFAHEWMTENEPGFNTWSVCCGAKSLII